MSKHKTFQPIGYAEMLARDDRFRVKPGQLHEWAGTHWQSVSDFQAERDALSWIVASKTGVPNQMNARSAVQTAMLHLPMLSDGDREGTVVPLQNGYLHIDPVATVTLREHDRDLGMCHLIDCSYDAAAPEPSRFLGLVNRILPDPAVRARVQEYLGYTLLPDARFQRAQLWIGSGANGKGTLASVLQAFHRSVAAFQLDATSDFSMSALLNASLVYCDEAPTGRINEPMLKSLIAGEMVSINRKYRDPVSARITGKWLVLANALPQISDQSVGFWRRFDIIPFEVSIPEAERDPMLVDHILRHERSGVLNWLLEGLQRLLSRGRFDVAPGAMERAARRARIEADSLRAWVEEACVSLSNVSDQPNRSVYGTYAQWCKCNGMKALSSKIFWRRLEELLGAIVFDRLSTVSGRIRVCNVLADEH